MKCKTDIMPDVIQTGHSSVLNLYYNIGDKFSIEIYIQTPPF